MSIFLNPRVEGALLGSGQITYGTSEDGRPQIRMIHPRSGIMMGIMEVHFSDASSPDGLAGEGGVARSAGINAGGARMRISRAHRRPPFSSSGSESDASWASAGVPPPETRLMERRSTVNLANGSALRSAAADSSASGIPPSSVAGGIAGGNPATAIAAAQQARSSFASFFSSLMDGAGRSATSPPGGGASARSRTAEGTIAEASPARGASSPLNRMTIRVVTRPAASNGGTLSSVSRDDRSLSTNRLPSRSSSGRSASGGSDDEGSGRGGSDEPIVVE
ncbi:hypothetical protein ACHAXA_009988 [Cyclostephanos tholiformis]|uniref:Uncharacterized protein n=1 Tax=Cyclostephanos tholiformis TaxID=382380 RepID=A0ABD3RG07_9STRA